MYIKCALNIHEMYIKCTLNVHTGCMLRLDPGEAVVWVVLAGGWRYKGVGRITVAGRGRTVFVG
jgi:hypothetical protein